MNSCLERRHRAVHPTPRGRDRSDRAWVLRGSTGFEYVAQLGQPTDGERPEFFGSIVFHQSVVTYVQWVPRLGSYTEWFSFYDYGFERGYQHNFGQGFYIYLTPNVQIDLRVVGTGFYGGDRFRDLTVGTGLSLRGFYHAKHREESARKQQKRQQRQQQATSACAETACRPP